MLWRANYVTDSGEIFYRITLVAEEELAPEIYQISVVKGRGFCDLPKSIIPRHAILTKENGSKKKIEYPFVPGTDDWILFWKQIRDNPLIIASQSIGERTRSKQRKT